MDFGISPLSWNDRKCNEAPVHDMDPSHHREARLCRGAWSGTRQRYSYVIMSARCWERPQTDADGRWLPEIGGRRSLSPEEGREADFLPNCVAGKLVHNPNYISGDRKSEQRVSEGPENGWRHPTARANTVVGADVATGFLSQASSDSSEDPEVGNPGDACGDSGPDQWALSPLPPVLASFSPWGTPSNNSLFDKPHSWIQSGPQLRSTPGPGTPGWDSLFFSAEEKPAKDGPGRSSAEEWLRSPAGQTWTFPPPAPCGTPMGFDHRRNDDFETPNNWGTDRLFFSLSSPCPLKERALAWEGSP
mmetsp:Transcript_14213/g.40383  ORF Transcript_14213/g.40383 Transcript_14213/m.40383 type:complete len:304 (-) Transcript_14213:1168-2079(-)